MEWDCAWEMCYGIKEEQGKRIKSMASEHMDDVIALAKRRGFIFQSAAVYGGLQGVYDFGPMGVEMKKHLKHQWWKDMVYARDDIEGLDAAILSHQKTFHYSGHEETFSDPMVDCKECKLRWRADHIKDTCPSCHSTSLTEPRAFNLMFTTHMGPIADDGARGYLRPETAQGIFTNFKHVCDATSRQLPFGIAQIGKAFRNEITPRHFIFRVREFEQMELEFFVDAGTDDMWHDYWIEQRYNWWVTQGLSPERLYKEPQKPSDLSHYSKATTDLVYQFPHGIEELEGIANRTDYDLGSHSKDQASLGLHATVKENNHSTQKLNIRHAHTGQWSVPYVIEPSAGVERGILALLTEAYTVEHEPVERVVLKLKPHLAPMKAAVIPLARNVALQVELAESIAQSLRKVLPGRVCVENSGNIGKSYRRHDEIGTPVCITVDFDTMDPESEYYHHVTVRDRDSIAQQRVAIAELTSFLMAQYDYYL